MVALKIEEQKAFTAGLFIGEIFDKFLVRESGDREPTTSSRSTERSVRAIFPKRNWKKTGSKSTLQWKTLKPVCYSLIKGKRLPESFRIVFQMPPSARDRFVAGKIPGIYPDQVGGLYINIQYENHEMICVTGTSMKQFTLDRTLENEWDENVKKFLKKNGVVFS